MDDILEKIELVIKFLETKYNLKNKTQAELIELLWDFDCIQDRAVSKADIEKVIQEHFA